MTITTVGYGDFYPITTGGRITAFFIMIMGVGIIGALASILSSYLVGSQPEPEEETPATAVNSKVDGELAAIKNELAALRLMIEKMSIERNQE